MKLKRNIFAIIAIAVCSVILLSSCSGNADAYAPNGMKLLSNEIVDYNLYIPESWEGDMSTGVVSAFNGYDNSNVSVMAFALGDKYDYSTTVAQFVEKNKEDLENTYSDIEYITEPSNIELGGYAAVKMVYTATVTGTSYQFMQVCTVANATVYIFTYTALPDAFDSHADEVQSMLDNFSFNF